MSLRAILTAALLLLTVGATPAQSSQTDPTGFTAGGRGYLSDRGRIVPVQVPGSTGTLPFSINARGVIVGVYDDRDGISHGFILDRRGFRTVDHPRARGVLDGVAGTGLSSINDQGQIIGTYVEGDRARGFLLERGRFRAIDAPGAVETYPFDINNQGRMTVQTTGSDGGQPHFLVDRGRYTPVEFPGADSTVVHRINERGLVVGVYGNDEEGGVQHGFTLLNGRYRTLDIVGTPITGLNQSTTGGEFVGYYQTETGAIRAMLMKRGRVTPIPFPGVTTSAYDINDRGQIVGAGFPGGQGATAMASISSSHFSS
jgi:uncharacterized membrane protein